MLGLTDSSIYPDIANAIRERSKSTETLLPSEMAAAIRAIPLIAQPQTVLTTGSIPTYSSDVTSSRSSTKTVTVTFSPKRSYTSKAERG